MKKTISIESKTLDALVSACANSLIFTHANSLHVQYGMLPSDYENYSNLPDEDEFGYIELECETWYRL